MLPKLHMDFLLEICSNQLYTSVCLKFVYTLSTNLPFMVTYNCYITSTQQLVTLISYKCTYNCYITSTQQLVTLISYKCTYNCYITSTQQLVTLISYKCTYNCYITSTQQLVTMISSQDHSAIFFYFVMICQLALFMRRILQQSWLLLYVFNLLQKILQ